MSDAPVTIGRDDIDAVVFDLDGVIADTGPLHARAWKRTLDEFLRAYAARTGLAFQPFEIDADYPRYLDGRARLEGLRAFLAARGIALPEGVPGDGPDAETVHGLGARKHARFIEGLDAAAPRAFGRAVTFLRDLRDRGFRTAVLSPSRNARRVLEAAEVADLFDACVDGVVADSQGLAAAPDPARYLEAARRLGARVERTAAASGAPAGVGAAKAAGFALVVGVDRAGHAAELRDRGADVVIESLEDLSATGGDDLRAALTSRISQLPSALDASDEIRERMDGRALALFLDFDGTLSPIVAHPADAQLGAGNRARLARLGERMVVAVVSGRDLPDVEARVGLPDIYYAGSHGFDLSGPDGWHREHPAGGRFLPDLDRAEQELRDALGAIAGVVVERKRFAVAVHDRRAAEADLARIHGIVQAVADAHRALRMTGGKRIHELRPDVDWDKGRAVLWMRDRLGLAVRDALLIYVGDDLTDEDAFRAVEDAGAGFGIVVADEDRETTATYSLPDVGAVTTLLDRVIEWTDAPARGPGTSGAKPSVM